MLLKNVTGTDYSETEATDEYALYSQQQNYSRTWDNLCQKTHT